MAINKMHPSYWEYLEKCKAISKIFEEEEGRAREKYPQSHGLDHSGGEKLREISIRHGAALKALQKEYAFLFE